MTSKLLPCPFCGSPAHALEWPEGGESDHFCCSNFMADCVACNLEATAEQWNKRAAPLSPDHSGGAGKVLPDSIDWIRSAARKWFYESFDDELLEKMQAAKLIAQAEGFSISVMAELELAMEEAYRDKVKELNQ